MAKPYYVKFETPKELVDASYEALRQAKQTGKIRKGTNEATKAIERNIAKLVIIAHLPILCEERNTPYIYVPNKSQIGSALGVEVGSASACIVEAGEAHGLVDQIVSAVSKLKKN